MTLIKDIEFTPDVVIKCFHCKQELRGLKDAWGRSASASPMNPLVGWAICYECANDHTENWIKRAEAILEKEGTLEGVNP